MKTAFYPKLAAEGMMKNKKLYLPYILTNILSVAMFYIITFLSKSDFIHKMKGGTSTTTVLGFGIYVIALFSVIFLFYTNSFLIRRRKKEFGLYNILGMNKHSIGKILAWEMLTITVISLVLGIIAGIAFSKAAELLLSNMLTGEIALGFSFSPEAVIWSVIIFAAINLVIFLNGLRQVRFSNPIELVKSESSGEKPPKANWVLGILGVVLLAVAYYIAVSIENPLDAFLYFFVAVLLVIVATYMIFISGSVLLCRILQKKKNYYYKKHHFISVSYMVYRMKRNGAGLASICILLTMVFVMISSTSCMYIGKEDSLSRMYPSDIMITAYFSNGFEGATAEKITNVEDMIKKVSDENGKIMTEFYGFRQFNVTGYMQNGYVETDASAAGVVNVSFVTSFTFIPEEDYEKITGESYSLQNGEALAYCVNASKVPEKITFAGGVEINIVGTLDNLVYTGGAEISTVTSIFLIVPDFAGVAKPISDHLEEVSGGILWPSWICGIDLEGTSEEKTEFSRALDYALFVLFDDEESTVSSITVSSKDAARDDFYGTYIGFFFLGISLSVLFLIAAVLIIYYKQISEGYEDKSKFGIMQKVGLTKADIKKSINSQMLTVFFLPIVFAALHMGFAFPMIRKLLMLFAIDNLGLLLLTTGISILVFALVYVLIYKITSNAYFAIVSDDKE